MLSTSKPPCPRLLLKDTHFVLLAVLAIFRVSNCLLLIIVKILIGSFHEFLLDIFERFFSFFLRTILFYCIELTAACNERAILSSFIIFVEVTGSISKRLQHFNCLPIPLMHT